MPIKLGMVMDSIDHINIKKDTSFAMLLEAQARGWELHYMELNDLFLRNGRAYARTRTLTVQRDAQQWHRVYFRTRYSAGSTGCHYDAERSAF